MPEDGSIRAQYIKSFVKLSLWYVHHLLREGVDFQEAINRRVDIYRNTALFDGERHPAHGHVDAKWNGVLERLRAIYDANRNADTTEALEEDGLALLWPYLEGRLRPRRREGSRRPVAPPYECWRFDEAPDRLHLHIGNAYRPKSPLSEMKIPFVASLMRLLEDARARRPEVEIVRCGTWMNSMPPFQDLFPQPWHDSAILRPIAGYGMGHWGQFCDRTGGFHARNGERLRATGDFPYPCLSCECRISDILKHQTARFPEAVAYNEQQKGMRGMH